MEDGQVQEAKDALENLLYLGPNNVDALKIKAGILSAEGRFKEEEQIWYQILEINEEDEDTLDYIHQKQIDFYFTDDLPEGGRRFLAYPRALVKISLLGLIGCISFLLVTKLAESKSWELGAEMIFTSFLILVISPWVAIIYIWVRSLKTITISYRGIDVTTRLKNHKFAWDDLERISLTHSINPFEPDLSLLLVPKDQELRPLKIDLNEGSSSIRARTFLVNEIQSHHPNLDYVLDETIDLSQRKPRNF